MGEQHVLNMFVLQAVECSSYSVLYNTYCFNFIPSIFSNFSNIKIQNIISKSILHTLSGNIKKKKKPVNLKYKLF